MAATPKQMDFFSNGAIGGTGPRRPVTIPSLSQSSAVTVARTPSIQNAIEHFDRRVMRSLIVQPPLSAPAGPVAGPDTSSSAACRPLNRRRRLRPPECARREIGDRP